MDYILMQTILTCIEILCCINVLVCGFSMSKKLWKTGDSDAFALKILKICGVVLIICIVLKLVLYIGF